MPIFFCSNCGNNDADAFISVDNYREDKRTTHCNVCGFMINSLTLSDIMSNKLYKKEVHFIKRESQS